MKKRNIILVSLIGIIILASFAGHSIISSKSHSTVEAANEFCPYWGPLKGKEINISEAQSYLPFNVGLPKKLGEPVLVKLVKENKFLYLIYSDKQPTPGMSLNDIINSGAIVLMEYPNSLAQESDLMIDSAVKTIKKTGGILKKITINGQHGMYGGNVEHVIYWFTGSTNYEIRANVDVPFLELIEIAESVKEE